MCMTKRLTIKDFEKKYNVHFTINHNGKMEGMISFSTSAALNPICVERAKDVTSICHECYANTMLNNYKALNECTKRNTEVFTSILIPVNDFPIINNAFFRFEAFGDIQNVTQVINYFNMAKVNKHCTFTIWTKNPQIIANAIKEGHKKPNNFIIGISSPHLNVVMPCIWEFVDFVFTVFTADYAIENGIKINCGSLHCLSCLKCYTKHKGVIYINEMLKKDQKRYYKMLSESNK